MGAATTHVPVPADDVVVRAGDDDSDMGVDDVVDAADSDDDTGVNRRVHNDAMTATDKRKQVDAIRQDVPRHGGGGAVGAAIAGNLPMSSAPPKLFYD
jgi:hypothetical protein